MIEITKLKRVTHDIERAFTRADLEFYSIDHFRPSYSVFIFFNDDEIDEKNCTEDRESFAGQFAVFGHAECVGDEGHCAVTSGPKRFDDRPSHPLTPAFRRVTITEALRKAVHARKTLEITLVAACAEDTLPDPKARLLSLKGMQLVTFE